MDSWLDALPSNERQKIREKYKMSPDAYKLLRETVRDRGPEYIEQEQMWNEVMAKLKFGLETQPQMKQALKKTDRKRYLRTGDGSCTSNQ